MGCVAKQKETQPPHLASLLNDACPLVRLHQPLRGSVPVAPSLPTPECMHDHAHPIYRQSALLIITCIHITCMHVHVCDYYNNNMGKKSSVALRVVGTLQF